MQRQKVVGPSIASEAGIKSVERSFFREKAHFYCLFITEQSWRTNKRKCLTLSLYEIFFLISDDCYEDLELDDMSCTKNEDELEQAEMRLLQRQLNEDQQTESQEERDYKEEFFELLDEVRPQEEKLFFLFVQKSI